MRPRAIRDIMVCMKKSPYESAKSSENSSEWRASLTPEEILRTTKGSLALEDFHTTEEDDERILAVLNGKITVDEAIEEVKASIESRTEK